MGRGIALGMLGSLLLAAALGYAGVTLGWVPAAADQKPGKLERWAALHSLHTSIRRESAGLKSPVAATEASLSAGAALYASHCLVCHGASDGKASAIALGLNIEAPQLATKGVEDDPEGETYWKVKHGIRFTGMPGFGQALSEEQLWAVTLFVARLDQLPPAVDAQWKKLPSAALPHP